MTVALKIHTRDISAVITSRVLTRRHFGPRCGSKIRTPLLSGSGLIVISSIIGWNIYLPAMSRMLRSFAASSSSPTLTAAASSSPGCWPYTIWTQGKCSWRCSNRIETKLKLQPSTEQFRPVHCLISPPIGSGQLVSVDLLYSCGSGPAMNWRYCLVEPHLVKGFPTSCSCRNKLPNKTSILFILSMKYTNLAENMYKSRSARPLAIVLDSNSISDLTCGRTKKD